MIRGRSGDDLVIERLSGPAVNVTRLDRLHSAAFGDHLPGPAFETPSEHRRGRVVLAQHGRRWIGYALASPDFEEPPNWYLKLVGVRPQEQRAGVGRRVSEEMLAWLEADGARRVLATPNSPGGRRLLVGLGFEHDPQLGWVTHLKSTW